MNFLRCLWLVLSLLMLGCEPAAPAFLNTDVTGKGIGGDFVLTDFHGQPKKMADFANKVVILFFGYTSCPDICPGALAKYAALMTQPGIDAAKVQVIFVSLDPERDSAQRLRDYVPWFHPSFVGLRGDQGAMDELARKFRVTSIRREVPGGMGYVLDHSAGAYVFGPDGRLRLYLAENARVEDVAADVKRLLAGQ